MPAESRTFDELLAMARQVIAGFDERNRRPWSIEAATIELAKQVGDLARHVMMAERYYLPDRDADQRYATTKDEIADELADLLLAIVRIADHYGIDLEQAHVRTREKELEYLRRFDAEHGGDTGAASSGVGPPGDRDRSDR
jgi:NTP pyrophosphatase (non-canonical NTP hydrolase)